MKKLVTIISLFLTMALTICVLSGCGNSEMKREMGKYTYWTTMGSSSSRTLKSYNDMLMYKELSKRTGVEVDFIHPVAGSTGGEAFQILLTTTDMPDMVEYNWSTYPGGADAAIEHKVIISLNEYMKESAPNYYSYMEGEKAKDYPLYKAQSRTNGGNYYGFKTLNIGSYRSFNGLYVRKDMLDKWGLDVPVTIDDWSILLKTAKDNGLSKPLTGQASMFNIVNDNQVFNSAWNVGKEFYLVDNKVQFGPEKKEYRDYLQQMAEWYKAGYIDRDFLTNESDVVMNNIITGSSVASLGAVGGGLGKMIPAIEAKGLECNLVACPMPVLKKGDDSWFVGYLSNEAVEPVVAITYACGSSNEERYKEAMKWCDYLYSEEGIILKSFGVEGQTYYTEKNSDGSTKYKYTISDPEVYKEFGGQSVDDAISHYLRPANAPGFNQHDDYLDGYYPYDAQKEALSIWNASAEEAKKHTIPNSLIYTSEEASRISQINAECRDALDAAVCDVIMNRIDLNAYDAAVKTAKSGGYDELLKIRQAAYDRYLTNLK